MVWIFEGPEGQAMKTAAAAYSKATGNQVTVQTFGRQTWIEKSQLFLTGKASTVDLLEQDSIRLPTLAASGVIDPIDKYLKGAKNYQPDDVLAGAVDGTRFGGKTYLFPTDIAADVLLYRTDLINQPPATFEQYLSIAKSFTKSANPNSPTKYGTAFIGRKYADDEAWTSTLYNEGGAFLDPGGKVVIDSPKAVKSLDLFLTQVREKYVAPETANWEYPEVLAALQQGTVPMASQFNAALPTLADCAQSPQVCGKIGVAPMPGGPEGQYTFAFDLGLVLNPSSQNKGPAADFALWVTGHDGGLVYSKAGGNTPRRSILSDPGMAKIRPWNSALLTALEHVKGPISNESSADLTAVLQEQLQRALAGTASAQEVLSATAEKWRSSLGQ